MKLMGVTGKSGAGKTTFSNIISQNNDVGVIHIDDLLKEIKLKYFKFLMNTDNHGEKTKVNGNLRMLLYKNRTIFIFFMKFRAFLLRKRINNAIKELHDYGKKIIIIDDIFINFLHVFNDLDRIFILQRSYTERKEALKKRDDLTLKEIVASDIAHFKGIYKDNYNSNTTENIINNGSKGLLERKAKEIYDKYCQSSKSKFKNSLINNGHKDSRKEYQNIKKSENENEYSVEK